MAVDFASDTAAEDDGDLSAIGSIISLAILESAGNHEQAIEALKTAGVLLSGCKIGEQATQCFSSAIYHLEVFIETESY